MTKTAYFATVFFVTLSMGWISSADAQGNVQPEPHSRSGNPEIIISGKLFCYVTRALTIPFDGTIISFSGASGKQKKAGDILTRYALSADDALKLLRRISSFDSDDLELNLVEANNALAELEDKKVGLEQLSEQKMAPSSSLEKLDREIELMKMRKQSISERLPIERKIAEEDRAVVEEQLGKSVSRGQLPKEGFIKAPIDAHVIWVNPELTDRAKFRAGTQLFTLGVLDPMIIRGKVHEIEALQIHIGDEAEFTLESVPGRMFKAKVRRISWASLEFGLDTPSYYEVDLEVRNPDFALREGLRGKVVFRGQNTSDR